MLWWIRLSKMWRVWVVSWGRFTYAIIIMWYIEIRIIQETDAEECATLRASSWNALPSSLVPDIIKKDQWYQRKLDSIKSILVEMTAWTKIVWKAINKYWKILWILTAHVDVPELGAIYVDPSVQSTWIWSALFNHLIQDFKERDFTSFFLRWLYENKQSRKFYEKMWCIRTDDIDVRERKWYSLKIVKYIYTLR